jgi:hypothetical protein
VSLRQQIPRRIVFAGSTSALTALRFYGLGLQVPTPMARILHGATLMDTENRFPGKMTPLDHLVMDRLRHLNEVAYVRFASVYRQFKDKNDFVRELEQLTN